jgi:hypothetical protein
MTITNADRRVLQAYLRMRETGPQLSHKILSFWLVLFILMAAFAVIVYQAELHLLGGLIAGFVVGAFLRDCRYIVQARKAWPVIREITDWNRVQELLDLS